MLAGRAPLPLLSSQLMELNLLGAEGRTTSLVARGRRKCSASVNFPWHLLPLCNPRLLTFESRPDLPFIHRSLHVSEKEKKLHAIQGRPEFCLHETRRDGKVKDLAQVAPKLHGRLRCWGVAIAKIKGPLKWDCGFFSSSSFSLQLWPFQMHAHAAQRHARWLSALPVQCMPISLCS